MTADVLAPELVAGPGVYPDLAEAAYHADPVRHLGGSLSNSGAKRLIPPSTPAHFRYWVDHPQPAREVFEIGHAAHTAVLGTGRPIVRINAESWTPKAKAQREEERAAGNTPLLVEQADRVDAMATELRKHRLAASLLRPELGVSELSLVWKHARTGVLRRARLDFLRHRVTSGRIYIPDYKTCDNASDHAVERAVADYAYDQQGDTYEAAVKALGLADDPLFVLIFQEKKPPYQVNVVQLDQEWRRRGAIRNDLALNVFARCTAEDRWPGYGDGLNPSLSTPPRWALIEDGLA